MRNEFHSISKVLNRKIKYIFIIINNKFNSFDRLFGVAEFILLYLTISAGITAGIVRFILAIVISILGLAIITEPALPGWVSKVLFLDVATKAYYGFVYMHHIHNHPILITFVDILSKKLIKLVANL